MMKRIPFLAALLVAAGAVGAVGASAQLPAVPVVDGVPLCGTAGSGTGTDDGLLKVASFNVLHSDTDAGDLTLGARLELEADALAASGADVVGMQEVTRNNVFDDAPDNAEYPQQHGLVAERFATELAGRTGEAWHWCWFLSNPHFPGTPDLPPPLHGAGGGNPLDDEAANNANFPEPGDFREGLAVVSRFPIEEARSHRLTPRSYEAPLCLPPDPLGCTLPAVFDSRQVLYARIGATGGDVKLFDTHIAHELTPASDTTKLLQVLQVLTWIELWSDPATPDFLTGDFNSTPDTDRYKAVIGAGFTDTWAAANGNAAGFTGDPPAGEDVFTPTNQRNMQARIDYVFARGCTTTGSQIIGTNAQQVGPAQWLWPSDHLGVSSTVTC